MYIAQVPTLLRKSPKGDMNNKETVLTTCTNRYSELQYLERVKEKNAFKVKRKNKNYK